MQIGNFEISKKKYREYLIIDRTSNSWIRQKRKLHNVPPLPAPVANLLTKFGLRNGRAARKVRPRYQLSIRTVGTNDRDYHA